MAEGAANPDGLTAEDLARTRSAWWDEGFSSFLREALGRPSTLADVGCGVGTAAVRLLPTLTPCAYTGFDLDEERLRFASSAAEAAGLGSRCVFARGDAEALPAAAVVP